MMSTYATKSCFLRISCFFIAICVVISATRLNKNDHALVTLVTGDGGYVNGALALGSSYLSTNGNMSLVVLVTPEVPDEQVQLLETMWQVVEVDPVACNHKLSVKVSATTHNLDGEGYKAGIARWKHTCTKFRTWQLTQYKRVVFMDSDMLVISPIDNALYEFSNSSFAAAPETFPPDTFNAGFMVLTPSDKMFKKLLRLNEKVGSAEGGDQGVLNNGLCPQWFTADSDDADCGRLPWIFNVEVVHYKQYETLQKMSSRPLPAVIHFVSDGKPWTVLAMDYMEEPPPALNGIIDKLGALTYAHALWRVHFFKATGYTPPSNSIFGAEMDALFASDKVTNNNNNNNNNRKKALASKTQRETSMDASKLKGETSDSYNKNAADRRKWPNDEEEEQEQGRGKGGSRPGVNALGKRKAPGGKGKRSRGKVWRKREQSDVPVEVEGGNEGEL